LTAIARIERLARSLRRDGSAATLVWRSYGALKISAKKLSAKKIYANGIGLLKNVSLFSRIREVNESIPHTEKSASLEKPVKNSGGFERVQMKSYLR
jgi:hypothetical protein